MWAMDLNLVVTLDLSPKLYAFASQAVASILSSLGAIQKEEEQVSVEMDTLVSTVHDLEGTIQSAEASYKAIAEQIASTAGDRAAALALSAELQGVAHDLATAIPANSPTPPVVTTTSSDPNASGGQPTS